MGDTRKPLGWSPDQCPICKSVQLFQFLQGPEGIWRECAACSIPVALGGELRGRLYPRRKDAERSMQTLSHLDDQVRLKPPEEDRLGIIRESFALLAPLTRLHARPSFDAPATRTLLTTLIGTALLLFACAQWADQKVVVALVIVFPLGGLLMTLQLFLSAPKRYVRRRIAPWMSRSLRSLRPTPAELEKVLEEGRESGEPIYRLLTAGMVLRRYRRL